MSHHWHNDLCACGDGANCLYACLCPHCAMASARNTFDQSNCVFNLCCLTNAAIYNIVREGYGIEGDCCSDIFTGGCCPCCAAMRINAEIHRRGPVHKAMH